MYLTRAVHFSATHRYFKPGWSEARNEEAFGGAAREHGHEYRCEVTVKGTPDPGTGMVIDLGALDLVLADEIVQRFDHRRIHVDVPEFTDGRLLPTGEMLCLEIWRRVAARLPVGSTLVCVRVQEDAMLYSEYRGE